MGERRRVVLGAVAIVQALDIYITFSTQISNLRLAEAAVLLGLPVVGANGGDGVEEVVGVVLVLDGLELGVVGAVEDVLPVGLPEVGLVEVSGAVRGELGERGHEYVGHLLLVGDHVFPGAVKFQGVVMTVSMRVSRQPGLTALSGLPAVAREALRATPMNWAPWVVMER